MTKSRQSRTCGVLHTVCVGAAGHPTDCRATARDEMVNRFRPSYSPLIVWRGQATRKAKRASLEYALRGEIVYTFDEIQRHSRLICECLSDEENFCESLVDVE